ncbi:potassium-transporting ATPase subunit KdpC [Acidithiobacillus sulfuriphilus]|uniref:potassium-transporting ATPase subunit KdpC n=1 Tax=Acidithiobacillus sulfuriphilus TaxID=1867749 RepID=UPI003F5D6706
MLRSLRAALVIFLLLVVSTGLVYPLVVTGFAQLFFPHQANGSLIRRDGKVVGSGLLGQYFDKPRYFWARPSATSPLPYDAENSGASNLGPNNPELIRHVRERIQALRKADPRAKGLIPVDLVTSSGSGLDPDISVAAAFYQVPRVAHAGGISEATLGQLVRDNTTGPFLGLIGEPVVNVLKLNLALQRRYGTETHGAAGK